MSVDVRKAASKEAVEALPSVPIFENCEPIDRALDSFGSAEDLLVVPRLCPTRRNRTIPNVTERNAFFRQAVVIYKKKGV
jgi:hypothetical protein